MKNRRGVFLTWKLDLAIYKVPVRWNVYLFKGCNVVDRKVAILTRLKRWRDTKLMFFHDQIDDSFTMKEEISSISVLRKIFRQLNHLNQHKSVGKMNFRTRRRLKKWKLFSEAINFYPKEKALSFYEPKTNSQSTDRKFVDKHFVVK